MVNFYQQLIGNKNLINLQSSLLFSFPNKNQQWKHKYFKIFNFIIKSYDDNVLKDVINISTDGLKKNIFVRKDIQIYKKIDTYIYNLFLDNNYQGYISLYDKKEYAAGETRKVWSERKILLNKIIRKKK